MNKFLKITVLIIIVIALLILISYILLKSSFAHKEGEEFNLTLFNDSKILKEVSCRWGLKPVIATERLEDGSCAYPLCSCYVCVKCGDGICRSPENKCNCPEDCK